MNDDAPTPPPFEAPEEPHTVLGIIGALFADLPGLFTDRVHLLALELRRASGALGQMVALALLAAILCATAWLALWIALAAGFVWLGMAWWWAAVLVIFINISAAVWALMRVKALAPLLALPATLRRLTDSDSRERTADEDAAREQAAQSAP